MEKILVILIFLSVFTVRVNSQVSNSANVSATVIEPLEVKPITITRSIQSDYRECALILGGSVSVSAIQTHSKAGSIMLPVVSGTFTAASFYTSGSSGYNYTFTIPPKPFTIKNGSTELRVDSFDSDPTLDSPPGLTAGIYVSITPFNLTVNYN